MPLSTWQLLQVGITRQFWDVLRTSAWGRVHDLKHTFGRRLRAAGVSFEDRQDLLGHRSGRMTTHYSAAEFGNLLSAANRVVGQGSCKIPALFILKKKAASAEGTNCLI